MRLLLFAACSCRPDAPAAPPDPPVDLEAPAPRVVLGEGLNADLAATHAFLAERPRYERPLGDGLVAPPGVGSLSAAACGACHQAIYEEWRVSTHALAWVDRQYQVEIQKSGNRWLCLNCHTPLLVQQDFWPRGLVDGDVEAPILTANPAFDEALREEGITCAACHVRDGVVHGPGLAGAAASSAPHPVQADPDFQGDAVCLRCHQAVATYPGKSFVCTFDTGSEWAAGPYPDEGKGCVDCHMPPIERPAAAGGPTRTVARHWWRGSGVPKIEGVQPPLEANPPGLGLEATWEGDALALSLVNANAGHMLPSGDPERWVQVDVTWRGPDGALGVDPWTTRVGQLWEWWPAPKKVSDNRLAPRERRSFTVPAPADATAARVRASSHRMTVETAEYHHLDGYPLSIQTHEMEIPRP